MGGVRGRAGAHMGLAVGYGRGKERSTCGNVTRACDGLGEGGLWHRRAVAREGCGTGGLWHTLREGGQGLIARLGVQPLLVRLTWGVQLPSMASV